jgi:hypothetical protein
LAGGRDLEQRVHGLFATLGDGERVARVAVRNEDLRMIEGPRRDADPLVRERPEERDEVGFQASASGVVLLKLRTESAPMTVPSPLWIGFVSPPRLPPRA